MNEQMLMDSKELAVALHFLPKEERLKLQGVIAGMRLALGATARTQATPGGAARRMPPAVTGEGGRSNKQKGGERDAL